MSTLIPSITFSNLKKLKASEVREMQCCEVTSDGEYLFTLIVPPYKAGETVISYNKIQAEACAMRCNTVGGTHPDDILGEKYALV